MRRLDRLNYLDMEDEKLKIYAKLYSDELERHSNTRIEKKSLVQENLDLKKQNTELAKVLRKSVRIVKQMDADVSNRT
ncbi:MAG: hypothetical protein IIC75_00300 [Bacteroidetes bacterium]|nr:hypothetical protein [Bacteroidota bacterium]